MKTCVAWLAVVAVVAGLAGWAGANELAAKAVHRGAGIVVALSPSEITLKDGAERHRLTIDRSTRIVIGSHDHVRQIGIGDYVGEECVPDGRGGLRALTLTLYRPAWMEYASPEN